MTLEKLVVIGYGNTLRSDDGAGQRVAEAIAAWELPNVEAIGVHQLTPELAADLAEADRAIFVDAYAQCSEVEVRELSDGGLKSELQTGHTSNPRSLLSLTKTVYGRAPAADWILVPAENFDFGEELSPLTERGIQSAIEKIATLVGKRH